MKVDRFLKYMVLYNGLFAWGKNWIYSLYYIEKVSCRSIINLNVKSKIINILEDIRGKIFMIFGVGEDFGYRMEFK